MLSGHLMTWGQGEWGEGVPGPGPGSYATYINIRVYIYIFYPPPEAYLFYASPMHDLPI